MKLQYLGDAKDAFKWDYLDFLARKMEMDLYIVPMLTPDDEENTSRRLFSASKEFCHWLRKRNNCKLESLHKLPRCTGGSYQVELYKPKFEHSERKKYFNGIKLRQKQILFLDPDIGFEPQRANKGHVKYSDIKTVWEQIDKGTIVVVFQYAWRKRCSFPEHYKQIESRLSSPCMVELHSTAVYWRNNAMLVVFGKSLSKIEKVRETNIKYQRQPRPVQIIGGKK